MLVLLGGNAAIDPAIVEQNDLHAVGILNDRAGGQDVAQQILQVAAIRSGELWADLAAAAMEPVAAGADPAVDHLAVRQIALLDRSVGKQPAVLFKRRFLVGGQEIDRPPDIDERRPHDPLQLSRQLRRHVLPRNPARADRLGQQAAVCAPRGQ